jgi:hypothetical protein
MPVGEAAERSAFERSPCHVFEKRRESVRGRQGAVDRSPNVWLPAASPRKKPESVAVVARVVAPKRVVNHLIQRTS